MTYDPVYQNDPHERIMISSHDNVTSSYSWIDGRYHRIHAAGTLGYMSIGFSLDYHQRPVLYLNIYNQMFDFIILIQR